MNQPITLDQLRQMPVGDIASLPVRELARLQQETSEAMGRVKLINDLLDGVFARRFGEQSTAIRQESGKEFGVIRFHEDGLEIIADMKKEVKWDQKKLEAIAGHIAKSGEDPGEYITSKTTHTVDERKFSAWPNHIKAAFGEARTVHRGRQTFRFETEADLAR
ncbi:MAG: hypothetical protein HQL95_00840 [Magnetococcales bacterium]|nr:hypothetical protein [Magnetococcales bacterium]